MKIVVADLDDLPEILAVQKVAFYDVAKFHNNFRIRPLQTTIEELESSFKDYIYYKVIIDNQIVSSARIKVDSDRCKIENVIVLPGFQSMGIGKELIRFIETTNHGCKSFELFTGKETPKNVNFYQGIGFEIVEEIKATETEPLLVTMRKEK